MARRPIFVLIDCNNFFASCERVFQPRYRNTPVAVLSNNDGCIVARSNEVKALGIPMGAPYFKYESLIKANNVAVFSANFSLYGDMSQRVTSILSQFCPRIEVYSVDESFLEVSNLPVTDYTAWAQQMAVSVERQTGIPVSVGVAYSKTLAKAAAERAKKNPQLGGAYSLVEDQTTSSEEQMGKHDELLHWLPLGDIWGIGRRYTAKLQACGMRSAYDLTRMSDQWILDNLTIRGLRTVDELRGISCVRLEEADGDSMQKSIASTRSFGHSIQRYSELETATASYAAKAAIRLRRKKQLAWHVTTFVRTGVSARKQRMGVARVKLDVPSSDTSELIRAAHSALKQAYDPDFSYRKAGVILTDLIPESAQQMSILGVTDEKRFQRRDHLMHIGDLINKRYGAGTLKLAAEGVRPKEDWHARQDRRSPMFTTDWAQLPVVR